MKKFLQFITIPVTLFVPCVSFAMDYTCSSFSNIKDFKGLIYNFVLGCVLNPLVSLIITLAVVIFIWGVFKYVRSEGDDKAEGRQFIIWGIVGLFVIVSVWGLVNILSNTFLLDTTFNSTLKS